jgi:hypothetical protein
VTVTEVSGDVIRSDYLMLDATAEALILYECGLAVPVGVAGHIVADEKALLRRRHSILCRN